MRYVQSEILKTFGHSIKQIVKCLFLNLCHFLMFPVILVYQIVGLLEFSLYFPHLAVLFLTVFSHIFV